jgi:nucleoid-associated protein YgaU
MGVKEKRGAAREVLPVILVLVAWLALACPDAPGAQRDSAIGNPSSRQSTEAENGVSYKIHVTIDGDTLSSIAGQSRIYGNSLKWTLIYLLNREELGKLKIQTAALPITPLPAGLVLALMLPEEARKKSISCRV